MPSRPAVDSSAVASAGVDSALVDVARLAAWLADRLGAGCDGTVAPLGEGHSNRTYAVQAGDPQAAVAAAGGTAGDLPDWEMATVGDPRADFATLEQGVAALLAHARETCCA